MLLFTAGLFVVFGNWIFLMGFTISLFSEDAAPRMKITCICRQVLRVANIVGKINDFWIHFNGSKVFYPERKQIRGNYQ